MKKNYIFGPYPEVVAKARMRLITQARKMLGDEEIIKLLNTIKK